MTAKTARWTAWTVVILFILLGAIGITLQAVARAPYIEEVGISGMSIVIMIVALWPITGALIISRHPRHPIGWLMCVGFLVGPIDMLAAGYAAYDTYLVPGALPGVTLAFVWLSFGGFPFFLATASMFFLLFPSGRLPSVSWRKVIWFALGALLLYLPLQALNPGPVDPFFLPDVSNPIGIDSSLLRIFNPLRWLALVVLVLCYSAALLSLIYRYRRARGVERQQIKWLVYPAGLFAISTPFLVLSFYWSNIYLQYGGLILGLPALVGIPIATAFAIFKFRLYDVDLLINKTLVYGTLSGTLALVYFSSVVLLQQVFPAESTISIVLSTLAIAALFSPLRRRIQRIIDRRFYRRKYDLEQTLATFSLQVRDEVELERLSEGFLEVVKESLQPVNISLWINDVEKEEKL